MISFIQGTQNYQLIFCAYFPFFEYTIASNKTHANRILQDFTTEKQLFTF